MFSKALGYNYSHKWWSLYGNKNGQLHWEDLAYSNTPEGSPYVTVARRGNTGAAALLDVLYLALRILCRQFIPLADDN